MPKNKLSSEFEKKLIDNAQLSYKQAQEKIKTSLNNISKDSGIEANKFLKSFLGINFERYK